MRWSEGMYDPVTLDQLRALVAVVEEGSFSAAARRLSRVQSAVSTSMANLETQLGVTLWDRSTRIATLTEQGLAVVASARRVLAEVDGLRRLTAGLGAGLEARVSLCVDALFPVSALVDLCVDFAEEFPSVDLRVDTQTMSAVSQRVLDGRSTLGVVSPLGLAPGLVRQALTRVRMVPVVAPSHPLARVRGRIATPRLASSVQIVLSERHDDGVPDQGVLSSRTWRVADLHTKQALLRAGLGWGNLPEHVVRADLQEGLLVAIRPAAWGPDEHALSLSVVHRADATFGPAHRWMLAHLETLCARDLGAPEPPPGRNRRRAGRGLSDKQPARAPIVLYTLPRGRYASARRLVRSSLPSPSSVARARGAPVGLLRGRVRRRRARGAPRRRGQDRGGGRRARAHLSCGAEVGCLQSGPFEARVASRGRGGARCHRGALSRRRAAPVARARRCRAGRRRDRGEALDAGAA